MNNRPVHKKCYNNGMINLTYEYKCNPTRQQHYLMLQWLETCRKVYNYALRERKDWVNSRKCDINACSIKQEYIIPANAPYPNYYNQAMQLPDAKKRILELKEVQSQVLQQTLNTLDKAFESLRERGFGFPRFKKPGQLRSFLFPTMGKNPINGNTIKLPKLGVMKMRISRPIPEGFVLKQCRVVKRVSGWYVMLVLQCDVNVPEPTPHGEPLGIDLGLLSFVATSNGELINRPKFYVDAQSKLRLLQRNLKRKTKGSKNWVKYQSKVAKLHEYISNCRKDYHFKVAHHLCDQAGMIFAEDLNLKALAAGMLSKHTLDAGWGQFLEILKYVCWKRGVYFARVDAKGTSQTCPVCDTHTGKKTLSERVHHCPNCGYQTDRDVAAAQVVAKRGIVAVGHTVLKLAEGSWQGKSL
jgi:putative transposase